MRRHSRASLVGLVVLVMAVSAANSWWSAHFKSDIGQQVAQQARPGDIRMLSSETCGICIEARIWFSANGVPFSECFIERDAVCRAEFDALRAPGTPVILVRQQTLLGFNPQRLLASLGNSPA
ncbi:MAG: glutaredoxin family protein [Rubrivivax sp.]